MGQSRHRKNVPRHSKLIGHHTSKADNHFYIYYAVAALVVIVAIGFGYGWYKMAVRDIVRTPLHAAKMTEVVTSLRDSASASDRFWGTYRSGLYFGMKTRSPRSPVVGMYFLFSS